MARWARGGERRGQVETGVAGMAKLESSRGAILLGSHLTLLKLDIQINDVLLNTDVQECAGD